MATDPAAAFMDKHNQRAHRVKCHPHPAIQPVAATVLAVHISLSVLIEPGQHAANAVVRNIFLLKPIVADNYIILWAHPHNTVHNVLAAGGAIHRHIVLL